MLLHKISAKIDGYGPFLARISRKHITSTPPIPKVQSPKRQKDEKNVILQTSPCKPREVYTGSWNFSKILDKNTNISKNTLFSREKCIGGRRPFGPPPPPMEVSRKIRYFSIYWYFYPKFSKSSKNLCTPLGVYRGLSKKRNKQGQEGDLRSN